MIRRAVVPIPVSGGVGSVTVISTNATSGFYWPYLNGKCIQVGLLLPDPSACGTFYCFDTTNFVPISGKYDGSWNWNGVAGLVGDITVNVLSSVNGVHVAVFIFDDGGGLTGR